MPRLLFRFFFFFFNDTATTEIYTLSLHDALPISGAAGAEELHHACGLCALEIGIEGAGRGRAAGAGEDDCRSEEHTSELQSQSNLVCRLLLEKKKKKGIKIPDQIDAADTARTVRS